VRLAALAREARGVEDLRGTKENLRQIGQVGDVLERILGELLRRGIHGEGGIRFIVQDGTIQEAEQLK